MGLLTSKEGVHLIQMLLGLPSIDDETVRRSLLAGLPASLRTSIAGSDVANAHVASIVETADGDAWAQLPDDSWSIIRVVENAVASVRGSRMERDLGALLETLKSRAVERARPRPSAEPAPRLAGEKFRQVEAALLDAFPGRHELRKLLWIRFNQDLETIADGANLGELVFNLLIWAESQGRFDELITAARLENPGNQPLGEVAEQLGLAPASPSPQALDLVVGRGDRFLDIGAWRARLSEVEPTVCRVEVVGTRTAYGTGFLLGPSVAMTSYHVVQWALDGDATITLRFGHQLSSHGTVDLGTEYRLGNDWLLDSSSADELDYALLRVEGSPGDEPVGGQPGAPPRRWLRPAANHVFRENEPLTVIQHPMAGPLKIAFEQQAIVGVNANQTRVWYRISTAPGSAGAPCFDEAWELVAIHHASRDQPGGPVQEGIPIAAIAARSTVQHALGT